MWEQLVLYPASGSINWQSLCGRQFVSKFKNPWNNPIFNSGSPLLGIHPVKAMRNVHPDLFVAKSWKLLQCPIEEAWWSDVLTPYLFPRCCHISQHPSCLYQVSTVSVVLQSCIWSSHLSFLFLIPSLSLKFFTLVLVFKKYLKSHRNKKEERKKIDSITQRQ